MLGGEQSGHLIWLDGHRTGDGLAAALLLCGALDGQALAEAAAVMPRWPQVKQNIETTGGVSQAVLEAAERATTPSTAAAACSCAPPARSRSCASWPRPKRLQRRNNCVLAIATLVRRELG